MSENQLSDLYDEAEALKNDGKLDEAIAKLQELLKHDDKFVLAHLGLAVLYGRVGKHEEAVKHGERACELEPTDSFSFTAMSVVYQRAFAGTGNQSYIQLAEDAKARADML